MIDMNGDIALRGYQCQVDAYRDSRRSILEVARTSVEADPKNRDLKLMLAGELTDQGKIDEGWR